MTKSEFLENLEMKLSGEVSLRVINQNLSYYNEYIDNAIGQGKSEEEVLEELGSPFLIAKTIIDMNSGEEKEGASFQNYQEERGAEQNSSREDGGRAYHWNVRPGLLIAILIGLLILAAAVAFTVLRLLLPILAPVLVVFLVVSLFKKRK